MQDNARPHMFNNIWTRLGHHELTGRSPDLNPIEHEWDNSKRAVFARNPVPTTIAERRIAMTQEWDNTPQIF